jgi:hypothetical protein
MSTAIQAGVEFSDPGITMKCDEVESLKALD